MAARPPLYAIHAVENGGQRIEFAARTPEAAADLFNRTVTFGHPDPQTNTSTKGLVAKCVTFAMLIILSNPFPVGSRAGEAVYTITTDCNGYTPARQGFYVYKCEE